MSQSILPQLKTDQNGEFVFSFEGHPIRGGHSSNGEPYFVANDVIDALGISDRRQALSRLSETQKGAVKVHTPGGPQSMAVVSETGLYKLAFRSNKAEADRFTDRAADIMKHVRREGGYIDPTASNAQIAALKSQLELKERQLDDLSHAMYKWVMPSHAALSVPKDD